MIEKLRELNAAAAAFALSVLAQFGLDTQTESMAHRMKPFMQTSRGQLGLQTILAAFVVVVAAMVIIIVVDQFDQSLGTPASSSLSTASNDILSGFGSMAGLIEPLLLIAIGVVIIGVIRRIR